MFGLLGLHQGFKPEASASFPTSMMTTAKRMHSLDLANDAQAVSPWGSIKCSDSDSQGETLAPNLHQMVVRSNPATHTGYVLSPAQRLTAGVARSARSRGN